MADCIDARITSSLLSILATITTDEDNPVEYNTNVAKVELARSTDEINEFPYMLVIPNENDPQFDDTNRGDTLNFLLWYLDGVDDKGGDPFTWRLRNVQADVLKALKLDVSHGGLAQMTSVTSWDYAIYFYNGVPLQGVYMYVQIERMIGPNNPYQIAL